MARQIVAGHSVGQATSRAIALDFAAQKEARGALSAKWHRRGRHLVALFAGGRHEGSIVNFHGATSGTMRSWHLELANRPSGGGIDIEVSKRKSWRGVAAEYVRISAPATFDFKVSNALNHVVLYDLYRIDGDIAGSDQPRNYTKDLRNKMTYSPAGCDVEGWCKLDKGGAIEIVTFEPHDDREPPPDLALLPPRLEFEDRMLRWCMLRFRALLDDPTLDIPGYAETLAEVLAFDLRRVAGAQAQKNVECCGLSSFQVQTVTEYIDSHLTEKTSVSELASLVDLTRFHFIRSFKRTTGVPPHQFMIRRRVDRAMEMLAARNHSIADVAARTGFGSPAQLTRAFRRVVGTTPSAFRRSR